MAICVDIAFHVYASGIKCVDVSFINKKQHLSTPINANEGHLLLALYHIKIKFGKQIRHQSEDGFVPIA